jgi:hypothetical protein
MFGQIEGPIITDSYHLTKYEKPQNAQQPKDLENWRKWWKKQLDSVSCYK